MACVSPPVGGGLPRVVAVVLVRSPRVFHWLGHMPVLHWSAGRLAEVRGVGRVVCVAPSGLADRARRLLAREAVEAVVLPRPLEEASDAAVESWLASAAGPAADADVVVVDHASTPFLPAAKLEACLAAVCRGGHAAARPARPVSVGVPPVRAAEVVRGVHVFRVPVPRERSYRGLEVPVTVIESLDVEDADEFVLADALVASGKL